MRVAITFLLCLVTKINNSNIFVVLLRCLIWYKPQKIYTFNQIFILNADQSDKKRTFCNFTKTRSLFVAPPGCSAIGQGEIFSIKQDILTSMQWWVPTAHLYMKSFPFLTNLQNPRASRASEPWSDGGVGGESKEEAHQLQPTLIRWFPTNLTLSTTSLSKPLPGP